MPKNIVRSFVVVTLIVFLLGCARQGELIPYPKKETLLMERSLEFYTNIVSKKYGRMYDMLSASKRAHTPKETYIASLTQFFKQIKVTTRSPEVISVSGERGITRTIVSLGLESQTYVLCAELEWVWENDSWFIERDGADCAVPSGAFK